MNDEKEKPSESQALVVIRHGETLPVLATTDEPTTNALPKGQIDIDHPENPEDHERATVSSSAQRALETLKVIKAKLAKDPDYLLNGGLASSEDTDHFEQLQRTPLYDAPLEIIERLKGASAQDAFDQFADELKFKLPPELP